MEVDINKTWENLCTASWDDAEMNLMCMAMGYNNANDNNTWFQGTNASNTTTHRDCAPLTHNCMNASKEKLQTCEGIEYIMLLYG